MEKKYHPSKNTIFSLAIGMKLNIDETAKLLDSAGYPLLPQVKLI